MSLLFISELEEQPLAIMKLEGLVWIIPAIKIIKDINFTKMVRRYKPL